jgi:hypothetical protein
VDPFSGTPTGLTASATTICSGSNTTLTLTGGGGGTGEVIHWYSGSCGGVAVGTGSPITVTPAVTTTYYGRYEDPAPCNYNSPCQSVTITVDAASTAPTGITASSTTICNGQSTTLTLIGGGGGTGAVLTWYTGSCGGAVAGTGQNLSVSPAITTTYYGGYVDACGNHTTCQSIAITVDAISTAPTGTSASPATICGGNNSTLSVTGGGGGTGAVLHWYTGSCGGTPVGTGNNLSVSPLSTTTYYDDYVDACGNITGCQSVTVTVTSGTGGIGVANNGAVIYITGGAIFYIGGGVNNGNYWNYQVCGNNGSINNSGTIELEGNWNNSSGNNVFTTDAGTTIFNGNGSGAQSIGGTNQTDFYNLTLEQTVTTLNINTQAGGVTTTNGVFTLSNFNGGSPVLALNNSTLTVTNPATTAIVRQAGYVLSETNVAINPSKLIWNIGSTTGAHVFPFGTNDPNYIPVTFNNTGAVGNISMSTRRTVAANTPYPGISNINSAVTALTNPSGGAASYINRWWDITSSLNPSPGITTIPAVTLTLSYCGAFENSGGYTTALAIQHFAYDGTSKYYFNNGQGGGNGTLTNGGSVGVTSGVGSATASGFTQFSPYVLVLMSNPLPVELLNFNATCLDDKIKLLWSTASESNNDYFSIDRSKDNNSWEFVTRINGAGNSNSIINYIAYDDFPYVQTLLGNMPAYYRMKQVDFNGNSKYYGPVSVTCAETPGIDFDIVNVKTNETQSELAITYTAPANGERITASLFNIVGQHLFQQEQISSTGNNTIEFLNISLSRGVYLVRLDNTEKFITRKIIIP